MDTKAQDATKGFCSHIFIKCQDYRLIILTLVLSAGLFYYVRFLENYVYQSFIARQYLVFHTITEFVCIITYIASFLIIYYMGERDARFRMKVLAVSLLFVGSVDFWHTLSYYGMPGIIVPGSVQTATAFWIIGRLGFAGGLLASSFIPLSKKGPAINRAVVAGLPLLLAVGALIYVSYFLPRAFPTLFIEGQGLTAVKCGFEVVIILMLAIALVKLFIEYAHSKRSTLALFLSAIIISIFSEMAFLRYASVYDTYNLLGHIYKLIAAYMIFRVLFIFNINSPYEKLDQAEKEISDYANNLEKLVAQRTKEINQVNQNMLRDIEYAKVIQKAIMHIKHERYDNMEFYSEYIPYEMVGGDYYGFQDLSKDYLSFYIGDVAGHGIPAAMMTIFMKQTIAAKRIYQSGVKEIYSPKEVIKNLFNEYNATDFPAEMYALMIYGIFNKKTNEIIYSSAGLNTYPLLYEGDKRVKTLKHEGFPICKIGKHYQPEFKDHVVQTHKGNKLLFYTDGIIDARNTEDEFFGEDRLIAIFGENGDKTPEAISREILNELNRFTRGVKLNDDVHYFIMKIT